MADLLLAEDLLLVLLDDEKGTLNARSSIRPILGGAVLAELALHKVVAVGPKSGFWRRAIVEVVSDYKQGDADPWNVGSGNADTGSADTGSADTGNVGTGNVGTGLDPVLRVAAAQISESPRTANTLVTALGKDLREQLTERLAVRGLVERHDGRVLGLFPRTTWPAKDLAYEQAVRAELAGVLLDGNAPTPRTRALISLLLACGQVHKIIPTANSREVKRRAKDLSVDEWPAKAAKAVIDAATSSAAAGAGAAAAAST